MQQLSMDWGGLFAAEALTVAPSAHVTARETSALAAVANSPARASQNARVLELLTAAGDAGLSDHELHVMTGYSRQTICVRRFDLRDLLTPAARRATSPSGRTMTCWRRKTAAELAR